MSASVFAPAMVFQPSRLSRSNPGHWRSKPTATKKPVSTVEFATVWRSPSNDPGAKRSFRVRASDCRREQSDYAAGEPRDSVGIQEDLNYLWKLGAGSGAAAAAIKYGSVLVPEITRPNLTLALIMITAPVVISLFLLIQASYVKEIITSAGIHCI